MGTAAGQKPAELAGALKSV